jgi:acetylornithine deacetylase
VSTVEANLESQILETIGGSEAELVELASALINFRTPVREPGDAPRQERELQEYLAARLEAAGASIQLWEPDAGKLADNPQLPAGLTFDGIPQLAATFKGSGGGASMVFNGHIDVVLPGPLDLWSSDPFKADLRDGKLYGRGACDMKGGVACMVFAAETLARLGVRLKGDLIVNTNTDEESSGCGSLACVADGVAADAGICPEPTDHEICRAGRGSISLKVVVNGRPGHVEIRQPHWRDGGAVNAIEKAEIVLGAIHELGAKWAEQEHAFLAPGSITPTVINGGDWFVNFPARCELTLNISYLPAAADAHGYGGEVRREVEAAIFAAAAADPWLAETPPELSWGPDLPPFEIPSDHPIIGVVAAASSRSGHKSKLGFTNSWFDAASFVRAGSGIVVGYGPTAHGQHGVDEHVVVSELVACARALALAAVNWCGVDR